MPTKKITKKPVKEIQKPKPIKEEEIQFPCGTTVCLKRNTCTSHFLKVYAPPTALPFSGFSGYILVSEDTIPVFKKILKRIEEHFKAIK